MEILRDSMTQRLTRAWGSWRRRESFPDTSQHQPNDDTLRERKIFTFHKRGIPKTNLGANGRLQLRQPLGVQQFGKNKRISHLKIGQRLALLEEHPSGADSQVGGRRHGKSSFGCGHFRFPVEIMAGNDDDLDDLLDGMLV